MKKQKLLTTDEIIRKHGRLTDLLTGYPDYQKESMSQIVSFIDEKSIPGELKKVFSDNLVDNDGQEVTIKIFTGKARYQNSWNRKIADTDAMLDSLIQQWVSELSSDLCLFLYMLSRDPDDRVKYSIMRTARRKELLTSYLQRLEILLDDPQFLESIGIDGAILFGKRDEYSQELQQIKSIGKRGGQIKPLELPLFPIIGKLDILGYNNNRKATFLAGLIPRFKLPGYQAQSKKQLTKTVYKWFDVQMD